MSEELSSTKQLMKFITGKWLSKPIYAAAELGLADILADGPKHIEELAHRTGTHAILLYRVLRTLAGIGIFRERENKIFELTPMAELLKTGAMRSIALMFNAGWNDRAWIHLLDCLKTGETAFKIAHGRDLNTWLEKNPGAAAIFTNANAVKAAGSHRAIIDVYDFSRIKTLADIGGGNGALMVEILNANPDLKGVVADLPHIITQSRAVVEKKGLAHRCQIIACDFFEEIPEGYSAYLLSHILHDWPDDKAQLILDNCREAMKPEAKLLVVEMIIPPGNEPSVAKLLDLEMMVITGGRERTEDEYRELLSLSDFKVTSVTMTGEGISIIEAVPC